MYGEITNRSGIKIESQIPILAEPDVVVAGAGVAGIIASIAASRIGVKVLLIEKNGIVGGIATAGLCTSFMGIDRKIIGGIAMELLKRLESIGGCTIDLYTQFDPEYFKLVALELLEEAGVELLLYTKVVSVKTQDRLIKGIVVEGRSSRENIFCKSIVDSTGDADLAMLAGVSHSLNAPKQDEVQPVSLLFRIGGVDINQLKRYVDDNPEELYSNPLMCFSNFNHPSPIFVFSGFFKLVEKAKREGVLNIPHESIGILGQPIKGHVLINATRVIGVDGTSSVALTKASIEATKQMMEIFQFLKKYIPGFENSYLVDSASSIGVRETRRILGRYLLTAHDILNQNCFEDAIARNFFPMDVHGPLNNPQGHSWIMSEQYKYYEIPYRSLISKEFDNLIVAGRCISTTHEAQGSTRSMPCCMATGQAAGTAAALSVLNNVVLANIDTELLQNTLRSMGQII